MIRSANGTRRGSWVTTSTPGLVSQWLGNVTSGLQSALVIAMIFLVLRLFLRRPPLALAAGVVLLLLALNNGQILTGNWVDRFNVRYHLGVIGARVSSRLTDGS